MKQPMIVAAAALALVLGLTANPDPAAADKAGTVGLEASFKAF